MENEELYTSLAYLEYQRMKSKDGDNKYLYIVRISSLFEITRMLQNASEDQEVKSNLIKAIKNLENFVKKVKLVLLDRDIEGYKEELVQFFCDELMTINWPY